MGNLCGKTTDSVDDVDISTPPSEVSVSISDNETEKKPLITQELEQSNTTKQDPISTENTDIASGLCLDCKVFHGRTSQKLRCSQCYNTLITREIIDSSITNILDNESSSIKTDFISDLILEFKGTDLLLFNSKMDNIRHFKQYVMNQWALRVDKFPNRKKTLQTLKKVFTVIDKHEFADLLVTLQPWMLFEEYLEVVNKVRDPGQRDKALGDKLHILAMFVVNPYEGFEKETKKYPKTFWTLFNLGGNIHFICYLWSMGDIYMGDHSHLNTELQTLLDSYNTESNIPKDYTKKKLYIEPPKVSRTTLVESFNSVA